MFISDLHPLRLHRRHHPTHSRQVENPGPKVSGSFQLVRYYGRYSNKMRGQRKKHAGEGKETEGMDVGVEVIDVSEHQTRRIPSKKWRDLIKSEIPIAKQIGKGLGGRSPHLSQLLARDANCLPHR